MARKKKDDADVADEGEGGGGGLQGKLKLAALILPTVLLLGGGVYMFTHSGGSSTPAKSTTAAKSTDGSSDGTGDGGTDGSTEEPASTWVAGKVVTVDAITINLANGHYLKVGVGLQATADAGEEVDTSKALDALVTEFSGKTVTELSTQAGRDAAKKDLRKVLRKSYEKKVYDLYWTSFVMN